MRLRQLDLLRALAIFLVLGAHLNPCPGGMPWLVRSAAELWQRCGWIGVDLFFVLSGFLVAGLLFREHQQHGEIRFGRFFLRRGLKIYPAFYVFLLATIAAKTVFGAGLPWKRMLSETFFLQNYLRGAWPHTWSLAVEEHFYILLPVALILLSRRASASKTDAFRWLPQAFIAVAVVELLVRCASVNRIPVRTHVRMDSLAFGVLLSYWHHFRGVELESFVRQWRVPLMMLSLAAVSCGVLVPWQSHWMRTIGLSILYLGFGGTLLLTLYSQRIDAMRNHPFVAAAAFVGACSYSTYLWHYPVRDWSLVATLSTFGHKLPYPLECALYMAASLLAGIVMTRLVEAPFLRLRDRLFPSRSAPLSFREAAATQPTQADALRTSVPQPSVCNAAAQLII